MEPTMVVHAHPSRQHGEVVEIVDVAQAAGFVRFGFAAMSDRADN